MNFTHQRPFLIFICLFSIGYVFYVPKGARFGVGHRYTFADRRPEAPGKSLKYMDS
tara:strand:- start:308 stop:475 length:168 start_codon:yes stop_codon:yes gene_type:complete